MSKTLCRDDLITARKRLLQMHYESGVGHIGGNLSSLDTILLLFHEYIDAGDQFILSKGHSAGALYTALWSTSRLHDADLKQFHKNDTLLAGHPPSEGIPEIIFSTGSLGHGLSLAAGTALAFRLRGSAGRVFCLTSDGEWQEGSTWEALIFASHHKLSNLTILVDHNGLQGFGSTAEVASMSPLWGKLRGFDLDLHLANGHDLVAMRAALNQPQVGPNIIIMQTTKGHGVSFMENKMEWHYLPMSSAQYAQAMAEIENS